MAVTAVSNKEIEMQRRRELEGTRRRSDKPSSRQEDGFQAEQMRPAYVASDRIANNNLNGNMQEGDSRSSRTEYRRGLAGVMRNGGTRRGSRAEQEINSAGNEVDYRKALRQKRESLKIQSRVADGRTGVTQGKMQTVKQKFKSGSEILKDSTVIAKSFINPVSFLSLISKINLLKDWTYISAIGAATFDDVIIDISQVGDIPVLGGLLSWMCQIFMGAMYLLSANNEDGDMDRVKRQMLRRLGLLLISAVIEFIPAIAMIPSEMIVGLIIFAFVLAERKRKDDYRKKIEREMQTENE